VPSLRAEIAELRRRLVALEARQLAWRHNAAGNPGAPDCLPTAAPIELTQEMRQALDQLWERRVKRGVAFDQVAVALCEDEATVAVTAYFVDGLDAYVYFPAPPEFDALKCCRAFEAHLHVV
jgi:hypothetical protein